MKIQNLLLILLLMFSLLFIACDNSTSEPAEPVEPGIPSDSTMYIPSDPKEITDVTTIYVKKDLPSANSDKGKISDLFAELGISNWSEFLHGLFTEPNSEYDFIGTIANEEKTPIMNIVGIITPPSLFVENGSAYVTDKIYDEEFNVLKKNTLIKIIDRHYIKDGVEIPFSTLEAEIKKLGTSYLSYQKSFIKQTEKSIGSNKFIVNGYRLLKGRMDNYTSEVSIYVSFTPSTDLYGITKIDAYLESKGENEDLILSITGGKYEGIYDLNSTSEQLQVYMLPAFGQSGISANSRGLIDMTPISSVFDDFGSAVAVMSYYPIFLNLAPVKMKPSEVVDFLIGKYANFTVMGYHVSTDQNNIKLNPDGLYVKFYIMERDVCVGSIEYYYNSDTKCFSYRQLVTLTLCVDGQWQETQLLTIEYEDIPVSHNGEYALGIDNNGNVVGNAFGDMLSFRLNGSELVAEFIRRYPKARLKDGVFTLLLDGEKEEQYTISGANIYMREIIEPLIGSDFKATSVEEANKFSYTALKDVMGQCYENTVKIFDHDHRYYGGNASYSNYQEFKDSTLSKLKNMNGNGDLHRLRFDGHTIYDLTNGKVASLQNWVDVENPYSNDTSPSLESNKSFQTYDGFVKKGFDSFFPAFNPSNYDPGKFIQSFVDTLEIKDNSWVSSYVEKAMGKLNVIAN